MQVKQIILSLYTLDIYMDRTKKKQKGDKKEWARQPVSWPPRPLFHRCSFWECYAVESLFSGFRYKVLPNGFSHAVSPVNQALFRPYRVTRARFFLMRSAACLFVIRFRQSGQYLTLFDFEAKDALHTVHRLLSSV